MGTETGKHGGVSEGATGLDFIVPPGYPNDTYRVNVQSGEHVQVTPAGQAQAGGLSIGVVNVYGVQDVRAFLAEVGKIAKNGHNAGYQFAGG